MIVLTSVILPYNYIIVTKVFDNLSSRLDPKLSSSGCHMLVITPEDSTNFLKFTLQERYVHDVIITEYLFELQLIYYDYYRWKMNVSLELRDRKNITWPPKQSQDNTSELTELLHCDKPNKSSNLKTPDGSFTFDLYQYQVSQAQR